MRLIRIDYQNTLLVYRDRASDLGRQEFGVSAFGCYTSEDVWAAGSCRGQLPRCLPQRQAGAQTQSARATLAAPLRS